MTAIIAVTCVGLGSFALRFLPLLVAGGRAWPPRVDRAMRLASTAALAYVTMAGTVGAASGGRPAAGGAIVGMGLGLALTIRGHRLLTVVAVGLAAGWLASAALTLLG